MGLIFAFMLMHVVWFFNVSFCLSLECFFIFKFFLCCGFMGVIEMGFMTSFLLSFMVKIFTTN